MSSKLKELLERIDPSRTIDVVEMRINKAVPENYKGENTVDSWEEYQQCLSDFIRKTRNAVLNIPSDAGDDLEINFGEALKYLKKEYQGNTIQTVYEIMQTGTEGGVYRILRTLARLMAEDFSQNEISVIVLDYWESLSPDEKLSISDEYIEKYKDILPNEIKKNPIRFRGFFWKVLEQHPRMIKRMRDIGKPYDFEL